MVTEPNNWGRFGPEDQRGTLNLLTGERVLAALAAAVTGQVLCLSMPVRRGGPRLRGRPEPQHFMSIDGADFAAGTRPVGAGLRMADDALIVSAHGTTTHMDALCHMWEGDQLYNGHPAAQVHSYGAKRCGIEQAGGVVARGVFFDVPRHLGLDHLPPEFRISGDLLEEIAPVGPGEVAVIRTGWPLVWDRSPEEYWSGQPGLAASAGRWLAERDVAVVAADNAAIGGLNPRQLSDEDLADDLHLILLHRHGVHLIELLWLEELSATGRSDFVFVAAPLRLQGGTASPLNPLAIL
ncbi:cyclase family protein [Nonomuraea soli]|uniref:Kynurenine formamidase n=1 Tax=Nonomuraea soli TaxID=1032476 RepID=A0A7W0HMH3_9ACTN|nr:cyclase family protein [Nonomuraea soli]MBA2888743.1 kynurenine formamidase [Nonomuraea soli]